MANIINLANVLQSRDELAANLRKLIVQHNISEAELARKTNIPQPTLHKILAGKTVDPRASTLKSLADYFGLSIDDLISGNDTKQPHISTPSTQSLPIISWEECLNFKSKMQNLTPSNWSAWIISEFISDYAFALISKTALEPRFPKGTTLIIDPESTPEDGDLVLVHFANSDSAAIRELAVDGPFRQLTTICKPANVTTTLDNNTIILGVVVKAVFTFA